MDHLWNSLMILVCGWMCTKLFRVWIWAISSWKERGTFEHFERRNYYICLSKIILEINLWRNEISWNNTNMIDKILATKNWTKWKMSITVYKSSSAWTFPIPFLPRILVLNQLFFHKNYRRRPKMKLLTKRKQNLFNLENMKIVIKKSL